MSLLPPLSPLEMTVLAGDGLVLKGVLAYPDTHVGQHYPLAILAHQFPATADSYAPLVEDLLDHGIAALAFDLRGHGSSVMTPAGMLVVDTPVGFTGDAFGAAFMSSAAKLGFSRIDDDIVRVASWGAVQNFIDSARIILIGASVGGSASVLAAPRLPGLAGLLTFGAAGELVWGKDGRARARAAIEQIKAPALLTSSQGDAFDGAANARAWSDGLAHVTMQLSPGNGHAMAIYYDVREQVLEFLHRVSGHPA